MEILPLRMLHETDIPIFGKYPVLLARLDHQKLPVAKGIVISPPHLSLQTTLKHYDFNDKEVFEQTITLVKKEIEQIPVSEQLVGEIGKQETFLLTSGITVPKKQLWNSLLIIWFEDLKNRLWKNGFYHGITEELEAQVVIFVDKIQANGKAFFNPETTKVDIVIQKGTITDSQKEELEQVVALADKKIFMPHVYHWIANTEISLIRVSPYTPHYTQKENSVTEFVQDQLLTSSLKDRKSVARTFYDVSRTLVIQNDVDGIFIRSEEILNLNKPKDSFEDLTFRIVESASAVLDKPVIVKLADIPESGSSIRGTIRLIHQKNLLDSLCETILFVRNKHRLPSPNGEVKTGLKNVHIAIPYVRSVDELLQIKRELAVRKIVRKNSLELWLELAVPENIINLDEYLVAGIDGVVFNLDELSAHLGGFDHRHAEAVGYKKQVKGLIRFLEAGLHLLSKSKCRFLAYGEAVLYPEILELFVQHGVYGMIVEQYESHSLQELIHLTERRVILRHS